MFVRSSRWGHHFLGHALVVRRAQCPCWIYCCQKKWFFEPPKKKNDVFVFWMFKFGCCFPAFCYNTIHLDPRYFRRKDEWIPWLRLTSQGLTTIEFCEKVLPKVRISGILLNGKRWQLEDSWGLWKNGMYFNWDLTLTIQLGFLTYLSH